MAQGGAGRPQWNRLKPLGLVPLLRRHRWALWGGGRMYPAHPQTLMKVVWLGRLEPMRGGIPDHLQPFLDL